jgi:DNA-binding MarR family transcriptional regulator
MARIDQISTALFGERSSGETLGQAEFLLLLDVSATTDQITLARGAGVDKSTTAYILGNLETRGLITRIPDPQDRRRTIPQLTNEGRARMPAVHRAFHELQQELADALDPGAVEPFVAMLRRIAANPMNAAPPWAPSESGSSPLADAPSFLCRRAFQVAQAQFVACTAALNLTPRQFSLLFSLCHVPAISQAGFAKTFGLDPSTCGVIMRNLAKRGLIRGTESEQDRRERIYVVTPAGRELAMSAQPLVDKSERFAARGLERDEVKWLVQQLQRIVAAHSDRLRFPGIFGSLALSSQRSLDRLTG